MNIIAYFKKKWKEARKRDELLSKGICPECLLRLEGKLMEFADDQWGVYRKWVLVCPKCGRDSK